MPGLIDAHTHLTSDMGEGWKRATSTGPTPIARCSASERAPDADERLYDRARRWLVRVHRCLARARDRRGDVIGPRIVPAGHAIGITGGTAT
jgi:imidazolonepropionase-like amidohydrolase